MKRLMCMVLLWIFIVLSSYSKDLLIFFTGNEVKYYPERHLVKVTISDWEDYLTDKRCSLPTLSFRPDNIFTHEIKQMCDTLSQVQISEMYVMRFIRQKDIQFISIQAWGFSCFKSTIDFQVQGIFEWNNKMFVVASDCISLWFVRKIFKTNLCPTTIDIRFNIRENYINMANFDITLMQSCFIDTIFYPLKFIKENKTIYNNIEAWDYIVNRLKGQ